MNKLNLILYNNIKFHDTKFKNYTYFRNSLKFRNLILIGHSYPKYLNFIIFYNHMLECLSIKMFMLTPWDLYPKPCLPPTVSQRLLSHKHGTVRTCPSLSSQPESSRVSSQSLPATCCHLKTLQQSHAAS